MNSNFMFNIRACAFSNTVLPCHTQEDARDAGKDRHGITRATQCWGPAEAALQMCVTLPCVSNSRSHSWVTRDSFGWIGWSWPPYTSPSALLLHLQPRPESGLRVEYLSVPEQWSPGLAGVSGFLLVRDCPWRRDSGWAGIFPSPPARRRQPGVSSPVWAAPQCFWGRQGSPRQPRDWGTSPGSGGRRREMNEYE